MIKGKTEIVLKDVKSGKQKEYADHNMLTNAFKQGTMPYGALGIGLFYTMLSDVDQLGVLKLFKGLVLFDDNIEEDPARFLPPPNIKEVGRGCEIAYMGPDTNLGSFNEDESSVSEDRKTVKLVWDFSTNQANGQIKSVCLLPKLGGKIGFNHNIWDSNIATNVNAGYPAGMGWNHPSFTAINIVYMDYIRKAVFYYNGIDSSTKEIKLMRYRLPMKDVFVTDCRYINYGEEEIRIPVKSDVSTPYFTSTGSIDGYIDFIVTNNQYGVTINEDSTFTVTRYNVDTGETTYIDIVNTTGKKITLSDKGANRSCHTIFNNDIYVLTSENELYRINLIDNTDVSKVTLPNEEKQSFASNSIGFYRCHMDNMGWLYGNYTKADGSTGIVQMMFSGNEAGYTSATVSNHFVRIYGLDNVLGSWGGNSDKQFVPIMNPWALYTINNLATPVTKTASETMKVTYTLTMQEET